VKKVRLRKQSQGQLQFIKHQAIWREGVQRKCSEAPRGPL